LPEVTVIEKSTVVSEVLSFPFLSFPANCPATIFASLSLALRLL
jgi:hypothetical protein